MAISVIDPVSPAINKAKEILFQPFEIGKWFGLGFCAFLAGLGSGGGGGGSFNYGTGPGGRGPNVARVLDDAEKWIDQNFALVMIGIGVLLVIGILFGMLLSWLSARGQFMFIDGIVKNRGAVVEPWSEYKTEGNSLFGFRFLFGIASFLLFAILAVVCAVMAWGDFRARTFGSGALAALIVFFAVGMLLTIINAVVLFLLNDFVAPTMYKRRIRVMAAWSIVRQTFGDHKVSLFLFWLIQVVLWMGMAFFMFVVSCMLCCIPALPYLGTVIFLPLLVFMRAYTLLFLEQFGPEWRFFPEKPESGLEEGKFVDSVEQA